MVWIPTGQLLGLTCLSLPIFARAISPAVESPSPLADTDLICPSKNPSDCYPRVFQPTKDFQIIKEGQDLPPGLHVRMNIWSGEKEARLNIPMEGEEEGGLDIPIEQAMVIHSDPDPTPEEIPALRDQVRQKPPIYESAGKIQPPGPASGDDYSRFQKAVLTVKMEGRPLDSALDSLVELSHDIYYGVEIAKDAPLLEKLVCFHCNSFSSAKFPSDTENRDQKASLILSNSLQNNPTALKELSPFWRLVMYPTCSDELLVSQIRSTSNLVSLLSSHLPLEASPATLKAKIAALSGFLREVTFKKHFLENKGMEYLLAAFLRKGEEWDLVRKRVAQLVMDNFLDEGMGAELGVWPKGIVEKKENCQVKGDGVLTDGCWEWHVKDFAERAKEAEWSKELLESLKKQRLERIPDKEL